MSASCDHPSTTFGRVICTNGATQVREVCAQCGANVRGNGINVPHSEVKSKLLLNVNELPLIDDRRAKPDLRQEEDLLF